MILERDDLESALANAVNNALLRQQLIRIGDDREACDRGNVGRELGKDRISPSAGKGNARSYALTHRRNASHQDGREVREGGFTGCKVSVPGLLLVSQNPEPVTPDLGQTQTLDCATTRRERVPTFLALTNDAELVVSQKLFKDCCALGFRRGAAGLVRLQCRRAGEIVRSPGSIRPEGRSSDPRSSELSD